MFFVSDDAFSLSTPAGGFPPDNSIDVSQQTYFAFRLVACEGATVQLRHDRNASSLAVYNVTIGSEFTTVRAAYASGALYLNETFATPDLVSCQRRESLWLAWKRSLLVLGRRYGDEAEVVFTVDDPNGAVTKRALTLRSTGVEGREGAEWQFARFAGRCLTQSATI